MKDEIRKRWIEDFEYNGKFFLAGYDNSRISGKVKYSNGRITLTLFEPPHNRSTYVTVEQNIASQLEPEFSKLDVMLGTTNDGIKITLIGCYLFRRNSPHHMNDPTSFYETSHYSVNHLFVGKHFQSREEIKFNGLSVEYYNFNEWLNKSSIEYDMEFSAGITEKIQLKEIPGITGPLFDDLDFQIHFNLDKDFGTMPVLFEGNFRQTPILYIHGKNQRKFRELVILQLQLRNLIQVGMFHQLPHILLMEGYTDKNPSETVLIYSTNDTSRRISNRIEGNQMFFTFDKIQKYLPSLFGNWLCLYNNHKDIFSLYFDTIWYSSLPRESEFNNMIQALEGYHRTVIGGKKFPIPHFKSLIEEINRKCTSSDEKKIIEKIQQYANEPNLKQRMREITDKFPYIFQSQQSQKDFIKKTIGARTYFAHREPSLIYTSVDEDELFYLIQKLHVIFTALLILELPIPCNEQKQMILKYNAMRNQFRLIDFP